MNKKKIFGFLAIFLFYIIISCKNVSNEGHKIAMKIDSASLMRCENNPNFETIDAEDFETIELPNLNDRIKNIKYIPIESNEPVGEIYQLLVFDEKIYMLDNQTEQIFIFDTNGNKVRIINDKGGGPKEYIGLGTMCISKTDSCLIISDRLAMRLLYYSLDGNFIKKENGIAGCFIESYKDKILNQLDFGQSFSTDINSNFHLISTIKDSVIRKTLPLYPIHKNAVVKKSLTYNSKGDLLCTPLYSDTVYQFINDSVFTQKYVVKRKRSIWSKRMDEFTPQERGSLIANEKYSTLGKPFLETDDFIAYVIDKSLNGLVASCAYYYDKTNKKSFTFSSTANNLKSLPNFLPFPITIYNNYYVGYIPSSSIEFLRELIKLPEFELENEDFREIISSETDWECIVVFYELK
jgi:hypothetical protein